MRAILIDVCNRTVQVRELADHRDQDDRWREMVHALGDVYLGRAHVFKNGDTVWVDDAAALARPQPAFGIDGTVPWSGWPFEGNGLVVGKKLFDARSSVEDVRACVRFFTIEGCYTERCRLRGIVPVPPTVRRVRFFDSAPDLLPVLESFAGYARSDAYAERYLDQSQDRWAYKPVGQPLTDDRLRGHLNGGGPHLGVYFIRPGTATTRLATLDFDDHDGALGWDALREAALGVAEEARRFGLNPWTVRSGGGCGINMHFLWDRDQPAAGVRRALDLVLAARGLSDGAGGVAKGEVEVFPKQDAVAADGFGNLIALPFGRKSAPLDAELRPTAVPPLWQTSQPVSAPAEERGRERFGDADLDAARDALAHLPADDYGLWIRFGLALKNSFGDAGFEPWDAWSRKSEQKYAGSEKTRKRWDTFRQRDGDGAVTVASIFKAASEAGWEAARRRTNLPVVKIKAGEISRMVDEAEAALIAAGAKLYRQGNRIVRVVWDKGKTSRNEVVSVLRLSEATAPYLFARFADVAYWEKFDGRSGKWVRKDCPRDVVEVYLARDGEWELPPLRGVVTAPTLRPDGSVLDAPGYDEATGLIFNPLGVEFPRVPEAPTRDDALRALAALKEPFAEFPFVPGANLAVVLSDVLTTVIRRSLPVAPMHAYSSPAAGTGKSLIVDIVSVVATGERAAVTSPGRDKFGAAELEKRLVSSLLTADAVISIDNLEEPLGGEFLCAMLSQERLRVRPLGRSVNVEVINTSSYHATGNNLTIVGDATRRVLLSRMDAGMERPELRSFSFDAVDLARRKRGQLVAAALTVVRAWLRSGEKPTKAPLGGYEDWCRFARDPLIWLGEADPVDVMEEVRRGDPTLATLKAVIAEWRTVFGLDARKTVGDVIAGAEKTVRDDTGEGLANPGLRDALVAVARGGSGRDISSARLAAWLRKSKGRVVDGCRLVQDEKGGGGHMTWRLEAAGGQSARRAG